MLDHPITKALMRVDPPLGPEDAIEAYIGVSDERYRGPRRHAFAVILHFSSGRDPIEITSPQSTSSGTHAQRANLGAIITMLEWLVLNQAPANHVTIYVIDEWMANLQHALRSKGSKMADLYRKIGPLLEACPHVHFNWLKAVVPEGIHHERHARAYSLARETVQQLLEPVS